MNSNRLSIGIVAAALIALLAYSSMFVVGAREQALVIRFGKIQSVKTEPGLYFKLPFGFLDADRVQYVSEQALRFDLDNIRVQVKGGKFYEVDAFIIYKITDAKLFREAVSGDVSVAESRLRTRLDSALRRVYGLRGFESALSQERSAMMQEVRTDLKNDAGALGISIMDVRIRRTDLTREVSQQTFDRMKAERLAEAELIRARGVQERQRREAIADRQVVEIVADARRESEILRGEGEGQRSAIFAQAYGKDPAFFEFYRSMNAYKSSLTTSDTSLVLSPNSDFFRFFNDAGGKKKLDERLPADAAKAPQPPAAQQ
ncbi:protease modulator HflC [Rhizobium sp. C1]|uniref:protease modulator HflC n=1 Tax=Rhizobium sp. C1 TaxID=1349799 RepID=UPI001E404798|nr:protease modulator HflC [Rhizobium sp. C1]MCD2176610.1 protease modulator HflC [Rhizobium sp. C1]